MHSTISMNHQPQYSSLNNSIIHTPKRLHSRANSTQNIYPIPSLQTHHEYVRIPSQKKLTLISNKHQGNYLLGSKQVSGLKKKGFEGKQGKLKFVSLDSSIIQSGPHNKQNEDIRIRLKSIQNQFREKFHSLKNRYQTITHQNQRLIYQLQYKISNISKQLEHKNNKILQLQQQIKNNTNQHQKDNNSQFMGKINQKIMLRVEDCEGRIRIISDYYEECQKNHQDCYENLSKGIISFFGRKINKLKEESQRFIHKSMLHLMNIELKAQQNQQKSKIYSVKHLTNKQKNPFSSTSSSLSIPINLQKKSQKSLGTRQSIQSIIQEQTSQSISILKDEGISFWDDCFFYPPSNQKSQNCNLLIDMYNRRGQSLILWLDKQKYLHYCDSDSFLYNRRGQRIKIDQQQLCYLVQNNVIIIN